MIRIALDFDNTYSADPVFWRAFAQSAVAFGHEVRIVTARDERFDRTAPLVEVEKHLPVIYTRGIAKRWYLSHFGDGFVADVWIDDRPESIIENSAATPEWLAEWRETREEQA